MLLHRPAAPPAEPSARARWRAWFTGLPGQCEVCRGGSGEALCSACTAQFAATQPRCARCGLRLGLPASRCGACLREAPPYDHTVCAVDYAFPWDRLIARFKFNAAVELARPLSALLLAAVRHAPAPAPQIVLPVPLARQRLAQRGYNQAWELARRVAAAQGQPARADVLLRPLETTHQASLARSQRQRNLRGAFMVSPQWRAAVSGLHVALVDDVMTTGATVREASAALLRAGAAAVTVWVLARTPESD